MCRLWIAFVALVEWYLRVRDRRVDGASPGCPAGKRRVYFAYKWNLSSIPEVIPWQTE